MYLPINSDNLVKNLKIDSAVKNKMTKSKIDVGEIFVSENSLLKKRLKINIPANEEQNII